MNRKSLVMIVAVLLSLGLGVGGTLGAQKYIFKTSDDSERSHARSSKKSGPLLPIGEFTVNLQGGSFLKTNITVQVIDEKAEVSLKEEDAFLKDRVNTVLSNKSLNDVQTSAARERLREELVNQLNEVADNNITDVLFISMVYQ
ncbi:flagellar basal body-associated FliL family protein [Desulfosporosinus nitroreducens]|uniref:Flagellar protein FliL n=1 Tax=Desulfosporosinus nitroreducens TaxID=2018668 RepID=A0ABT8QPG0_9FIRM|nr:flagellar basal body-associated FliL family protein [Desulfosporosinus nitroreducens]MCO1601305.1 flagellar basal body-associated FliL family protein [Desulfosporosinus nitroreducens]MDO0821806.1 flagellar basal body-associated FliL family protein [Desulfosporosinus nitroreducens]